MKVLITGSGVIGTHVAKRLLEQGDEVVLVDLNPQEVYVQKIAGEIEVLTADLSDRRAVKQILEHSQIEVVVHTAGRMGHSFQTNPLESYQSNIVGTSTLADACRNSAIKRFVYCSSLAVYGALHNEPVTENRPPLPQTAYGVSKYANELYLHTVSDQGRNFELVTLRLSGVYGFGLFAGGAWMGKLLNRLIVQTIKNPACNEWGELGTNEYLYVKDVAAAVSLAVHKKGIHGEVYNISTETQHDHEDVRRACLKALGVKIPEIGRSQIPGMLDSSKARQELGFHPAYSLEQGMKEVVDQISQTLEGR